MPSCDRGKRFDTADDIAKADRRSLARKDDAIPDQSSRTID